MNGNFLLRGQRRLAEYDGIGRLYQHASGAQVFALANRDENKVFSIAFRTPPTDDSGLPHVVEHTVLAGSRKYPLKEPFNELLKGSLYTYLNAMTYRDHTVYPIASRNARDFMNLAAVYFDAAFCPLLRAESFWQEGVQYALPRANAPLTLNGVVYSEMQGAYADPRCLVQNRLMQSLFPQSSLRFDAAGDPACIPVLTHEALTAYYARHYKPANSFIFVYGDADMEACFDMIDGYLSGVSTAFVPLEASTQRRLRKPVLTEGTYASSDGDKANRGVLGAAFVLDNVRKAEKVQAWQALAYILFETEASPLKRALGALGAEVSGGVTASLPRAVLEITVTNTSASATEWQAVIREETARIVREGLDAQLVDACLDRLVFQAREADFGYKPKGLAAHIQMLPCWLNGGNPFAALSPVAALERLRGKVQNGLFEAMLDEGILRNTHSAFTRLSPDTTLDARRDAALREALRQKKIGMTDTEIKTLTAQTKQLARYQSRAESPRALASLPMVALADVRRAAARQEIVEMPCKAADVAVPMLQTRGEGNGVAYAWMRFDASAVAVEDRPYMGVLARVLGKMDTADRPYAALAGEMNAKLGGVAAETEALRRVGGGFTPYLTMFGKALDARTEDLFALAGEIAARTVFADKTRLRTLLSECKAGMEDALVAEGHMFARRRAESQFAASALYEEQTQGIAFYNWLVALLREYDARAEGLCAALCRVAGQVLTRVNLRVAVASDVEGRRTAAEVKALANGLPCGEAGVRACGAASLGVRAEALIVSSPMQCNVLAADMRAAGYAYDGSLRVLQNVAGQGFLLEALRLKGGAYGCGAVFGRTGLMHLYSFRDPRLLETYDDYAALAAAMARFEASPREMQKCILGTIGEMDRPTRPGKASAAAIRRHMAGITDDMMQMEREAVLAATPADIRRAAEMLADCVRGGNICTIGGQAAIAAAAESQRFAAVRHIGI